MIRLLLAAVAVAVTGCTTLKTNYDYDRGTDFSQFRQFAWFNHTIETANRVALLDNELLRKRIRAAVTSQLTARNMTLAKPADADFLVAHHIASSADVDAELWSHPVLYGHGPPATYPLRGDVRMTHYALLVVDILDGQSEELVWRGWQRVRINGASLSPSAIHYAVADILSAFPPVATTESATTD